jgi:hypothetical protein
MIRLVFSFARWMPLLGLLLIETATLSLAEEVKPMTFSGLGWVQYGTVVHSTDTANTNTNGNSIQTQGAQITLFAEISKKLSGKAGLGVIENLPLTGEIKYGGLAGTVTSPYIAEASFEYKFWENEDSKFNITGGLFHYNYNPEIQNLGLYLLRGPVNPGILISGFETKHVLPIANILGFQLRHQFGGFQQDLLVNSENELFPYYDISPAYIAQYQFGTAFRLGAGVNLYHWIPIDAKLTTPPLDSVFLLTRRETTEDKVKGPYDRVSIYVDTTEGASDTTIIGFQGTKVMANFSWDPKVTFDMAGWLGSEDLLIYGEMAIIGLNTSKAYTALYGDTKHRMPIMMGFNLPVFQLLDHLSLEVEWYGARFKDDYSRYQNSEGYYESPIPVSNSFLGRIPQPYVDTTGKVTQVLVGTKTPFEEVSVEKNLRLDNWKWSLHGSKIIQDHFRVSFQVANDHFRPGGIAGFPSQEAILTTMKDWYWMSKVAYFF